MFSEIPRSSWPNEEIDYMAGHQTKGRTFNSLQLCSRYERSNCRCEVTATRIYMLILNSCYNTR